MAAGGATDKPIYWNMELCKNSPDDQLNNQRIPFASVQVSYKMSKKLKSEGLEDDTNEKFEGLVDVKKKFEGLEDVKKVCIAFLNNSSGGMIQLNNKNNSDGQTVPYAEFDDGLIKWLNQRGQMTNYIWYGAKGSRLNAKRRIFIKPVQQEPLAYQSCVFAKTQNSVIMIDKSTEITKIAKGKHKYATSLPLESLPNAVICGQVLKDFPEDILIENKGPTKEVTFDNHNNDKSGQALPRYVSAFANTNGGHILYGVHDKSLKVQGIKFDEKKVKGNIDRIITSMVWFVPAEGRQMSKGDIGKYYRITIIPVKEAKDGKDGVLVVTVMRPLGAVVFSHTPIVPFLLPYEQGENVIQYMNLTKWFEALLSNKDPKQELIDQALSKLTSGDGELRVRHDHYHHLIPPSQSTPRDLSNAPIFGALTEGLRIVPDMPVEVLYAKGEEEEQEDENEELSDEMGNLDIQSETEKKIKGDQNASDADFIDVICKTELTTDDLINVLTHLGMSERMLRKPNRIILKGEKDVENGEQSIAPQLFILADRALREWRDREQSDGRLATRKSIIDILRGANLVTAERLLTELWGIQM
ncbi:uncharacterized protein [Amphiura filiformis]|uniref:uncharacterized protein n=1 Tax=Amphiura filiformis TaxID=82378 RepID=UPI003B2214B9